MRSFTPAVKAELERCGCYLLRQGRGDHEIWFSPVANRAFTVDGKIMSRHLANAVMRQAGLEHRFR